MNNLSTSKRTTGFYNLLTALCTCTMLAACGGGGGSSSSLSLQTGILLDSPVSGIQFTTPSQSGVTNTQGEFIYMPGESVTFSLGGLTLGEVNGQQQVTIFELAGVSVLPSSMEDIYEISGEEAEHRPFHTAINIGVLLQSLDADGVVENGIEIESQVAELFAADTLWLSQPYTRFQTSHRLRQILRQASSDNILTSRNLVSAGAAFAHMLDQIENQSVIYLARTIETDSDGITGAERIFSQTVSTTGRINSTSHDSNGDGNPNSLVDYIYDSAGNPITVSADNDADGTYDSVTSFTYSAFGEMLRKEIISASNTTTYLQVQTYDDQGLLVRQETTQNGNLRVLRWGSDGAGTRTYAEYDNDGDGSWDRRDNLTYDSNDRWVDRYVDLDLDGSTDQRWQRTYNALGKLTMSSKDTNNDGSVDELEAWRYNSNGQPLEFTRSFPNDNSANSFRTTYSYDAQNNYVGQNTYINETLSNSFQRSITTTQDGGEIQTDTWDNNADNVFERRRTRTYDVEGKLITRVEENQLDTNSPTSTTYQHTYDNLGRLTSRTNGTETITYSDFVAIPLGHAL